MVATAFIACLVGKLLPDLGEPVPMSLWRPARPTFDQLILAAFRHHTNPATVRRLLRKLFPGRSGKR